MEKLKSSILSAIQASSSNSIYNRNWKSCQLCHSDPSFTIFLPDCLLCIHYWQHHHSCRALLSSVAGSGLVIWSRQSFLSLTNSFIRCKLHFLWLLPTTCLLQSLCFGARYFMIGALPDIISSHYIIQSGDCRMLESWLCMYGSTLEIADIFFLDRILWAWLFYARPICPTFRSQQYHKYFE